MAKVAAECARPGLSAAEPGALKPSATAGEGGRTRRHSRICADWAGAQPTWALGEPPGPTQNGPNSSKMIQIQPKPLSAQLVEPSGLAQNGPNWPKIIEKWPKMAKIGKKCVALSPDWAAVRARFQKVERPLALRAIRFYPTSALKWHCNDAAALKARDFRCCSPETRKSIAVRNDGLPPAPTLLSCTEHLRTSA